MLGTVGCGDASTPATPPTATFRDSAGVTLVDNPAEAAAPLPWSVGDAPSLRIGVLEGPEAEQFSLVRDSYRLPDGRIAVADMRAGEVRFFWPDGTHETTWGRSGEGPGEFRGPTRIVPWDGDSLAVWDDPLRRLSVFDASGSFARSIPFTGLDGGLRLRFEGRMGNGDLVATVSDFLGSDLESGRIRPGLRGVVMGPGGEVKTELGTVPGREGLLELGEGSVMVYGLPFARRGVAAAVGARVVLAATDRWTLSLHRPDGTVERIVRVALPPEPVTPDAVDAFVEHAVGQATEGARPSLRRALERAPAPDSMPAFEALLPAPDGGFWVQAFRPAHQEGPRRWLVFDPEGRLLGSVVTPAGFVVHQLGADFILGTTTDELGVPRVELRPLRR